MAKQNQMISAQAVACLAVLGFLLISSNVPDQSPGAGLDFINAAVSAAEFETVKLTGKLVNWISEQCEQISQEMDAIIRLEAAESAERFSLVNYLRYLALYDQLRVVAKRNEVDKFRWIGRKVKAYQRAYNAAANILMSYLNGLDAHLSQIESGEKKNVQQGVGKEWVQDYETINYIATHAPKDSKLANRAFEVMQKSPNGTEDKKRSIRYSLYIRVN